MAKPLTRGQKAAETRKRNATEVGNQQAATSSPAPMNASLEKVFIVFTEGLSRLERAVLQSIGDREDAPNPAALGYATPRITEVPQGALKQSQAAPQEGPPPLQELLDEAGRRSSQLLGKAESLKHRILHGDTPMGGENRAPSDVASYGIAKDASLYTLRNMTEVDALLDFFASYFIS